MTRTRTVLEQMADLDVHIRRNGLRLARYRELGADTSCLVLRGVIDRLLDARLLFMRDRDRN